MFELIGLEPNSGYYKYRINQREWQDNFINWAQHQPYCIQLNSHQYYQIGLSEHSYHKYEHITAVSFHQDNIVDLSNLELKLKQKKAWYFGYFSYDIKDEIHPINVVEKEDLLGFDNLFFFQADLLIYKQEQGLFMESSTPINEDLIKEINEYSNSSESNNNPFSSVQSKISKQRYIKDIEKVQSHIQQGDIYELNYCQEFFIKHIEGLDCWAIYKRLCDISPTPFAAFLKQNDKYVMSASPERYLCKRNNRIISQPIKGTIKMSDNEAENESLKKRLREDIKEQSENVMIVDLVRNDLSRTAKKGSVQVDELMGIYPFKHLYQMISTVSSELQEGITLKDIIETSFPMGSMTGAPKIRAMQLAEQFEAMKRGLYSGAIGYIDPEGDFDFNVIIRSLLYNATNKYLSFCVGSAITIKANAEKEYEECLLKAEAIIKCLNQALS